MGETLLDEIRTAQAALEIARNQLANAEADFLDTAIMQVNACESRLNTLYTLAKREQVSA